MTLQSLQIFLTDALTFILAYLNSDALLLFLDFFMSEPYWSLNNSVCTCVIKSIITTAEINKPVPQFGIRPDWDAIC